MGLKSFIKNIKLKLLGPKGEQMRISGGTATTTYQLDSSKVDYELARQLYQNNNDDYKLGAPFVRPIINSTVGFMGVPHFDCEDESAQEILDDFVLDNTSQMLKTHTDALKLGDSYVWITREEVVNPLYPDKPNRLIYNFIPPEQIKDILLDPTTGEPTAYILKSHQEWQDIDGNKYKCDIIQAITAEERVIQITGDTPEGIQAGTTPNPWGFIPIVHFKNEPDETLKYGQSDIEPIEPLLKAYHDVMLHALKGSKMHSTPKLKMKLKDVAGFLRNNFGIEDPTKFAKEGGKVNLDGHEVLFMTTEEDAGFIEVNSATGDAKVLLSLLFYCIIDVSEVPEFIFGVHTPSALASVKEQMPIMANKIRRKREQVTEQWRMLARMVLIMSAQSVGGNFSSYDVTLGWDQVTPKDDKESAETLNYVASALETAITGGFISVESASNFLAKYVDTMNDYISSDEGVVGEREKIIKDKMLNFRMGDSGGLEDEKKKLDDEINNSGNQEGNVNE